MVKFVHKKDISKILNDLENNELTREAASRWAMKLILEDEKQYVVFSPKEEENSLFRAIKWLSGYDLQIAPGAYLHGREDLAEFRKNSGL